MRNPERALTSPLVHLIGVVSLVAQTAPPA